MNKSNSKLKIPIILAGVFFGVFCFAKFSLAAGLNMDEVRIYNRVLTADEIKQLYLTDGARTKINSPISGRMKDSSLVGEWSFDGADMNWSTNTAYDRSGQSPANNGTMTNMSNSTAAVPGINGQALKFDGVNDYVDAGASTAFNLSSSPFSVSAWIRPNDFTMYNGATPRIIIKRQDANNGWMLNLDSTIDTDVCSTNSVSFVMVRGGVSAPFVCYNGPSLSTGQWYYVVGVSDGTNLSIYINGAAASVATRTVDYGLGSSNNLFFGWRSDAFGYYNGSLDEVRVYNRALSAGEISQLYQFGAARMKVNTASALAPKTASGLVGYWSFNGPDTNWSSATAGTTNDLSGNNNTGTMTNMSQSTSPVPGISGQALKFDGVNDYVDGGSAFNFTSGDFTISYWVKLNSYTSNSGSGWATGPTIIYKGGYQVAGYYDRINTDGAVVFDTNQSGANQGTISNAGAIPLGVWTNVIYVRSGSTVTIYSNGQDQTSSHASHVNPASSSDHFSFGGYNGGADFTNGSLDELRVYNRALTQSEITQLYQAGARKVAVGKATGGATAPVTWSMVQSNTATDSTTITLNGVGAGNLIVLGIKWAATAPGGATATDGTTSLTMGAANYYPSYATTQFGYLLSANGGNITYTVTPPAGWGYIRLEIYEFSHTGGVAVFDAENATAYGTTSGNNTAPSGTISTTGASEVVFGLVNTQYNNMSSPTIAGASADGNILSNSTNGLSYKIFSSTQSNITASWAHTDGDIWISSIIAFKGQ